MAIRKKVIVALLMCFLAATGIAFVISGANFTLMMSGIASLFGVSSGGSYVLQSSVAENIGTEPMSGGNYAVTPGDLLEGGAYPAPAVTAVSPSIGARGGVTTITITGTNFLAAASVEFSGTGITVSSTVIVSASQITCEFSISASAAAGPRDITITNTDSQSVTKSAGFIIEYEAPTITSVSPGECPQGNSVQLKITGTGFQAGAMVAFSGSGVAANTPTVSSDTEIIVMAKTAHNAALGARDITVTNIDNKRAVKQEALVIKVATAQEQADVPTDTAVTASIAPPTGEMTVDIPVGTFSEPVVLTVSTFIVPAHVAVETIKTTNLGIEIKNDKDLQPNKKITITVSYRAGDIAGLDASKLVLARYDEARQRLIPLPSTVDPATRKVTCVVVHLSKFAVIELRPASNLDSVKVYPNPFNPGRDSLIIDNLTASAEVKIYTIAGELVRTVGFASVNGRANWDGKNDSGSNVASGVYVMYITSPEGKKKLKIAVEK